MRQLLVVIVLSLFLVAPLQTATASATTYTNLDATGGDNWASMTLSSPVKCLDTRLFFNFTGLTDSFMAAFWFRGPGEWLSGYLWSEGVSTRVVIDSSVTGRVMYGSSPNSLYFGSASGYQWPAPNNDLQVCTLLASGWTHVAFSIPDAVDARMRIGSNGALPGPTITSGSGAVAADARDFSGTYAEAEVFGLGASAVLSTSFATSMPQGMIAFFTATTTTGYLDVSGPGGFYRSAYCGGGSIYVGLSCAETSAVSFAHVGDGTAPAGSYTFRYSQGAAAEAVHLFVVAAPVNW